MSIFSAIGKALGGIAKAGLSVVTHGVSDKVLSVLKGTGRPTVVPPSKQTSISMETAVAKIGQAAPKMSRTEQVMQEVGATKKKKKAKKKAVKKTLKKAAASSGAGRLDLKKISTMWNAAGKPGKWLDFIKANTNVRV